MSATNFDAIEADTSITAGTAVEAKGVLKAKSKTAAASGGQQAIQISDAALRGIYFGNGAPSVSANKGSLYLRTDGTTTNDRMYVNTDGGSGWTAVITAA